MEIKMQSYPPLGQVTSVEDTDLAFTAVLEVPEYSKQLSWEVALWHCVDDGEWAETSLFPMEADRHPVSLQTSAKSASRLFFVTPLSFERSVKFTLKFRSDYSLPWQWVRDEQGIGDGFILRPVPHALSDDVSTVLPDLNDQWKVQVCTSEAPRTQLWSLEATIAAADGDQSTYKDIEIGTPWKPFVKWFALVQHMISWMGPRQGKEDFNLDKDGFLCSFLNPGGRHLVFLAVSGITDVISMFRSTSQGALSVHARNDGLQDEAVVILVSESEDFDCAVAAVFYHARKLLARANIKDEPWEKELKKLGDDVKPLWRENWYDGLGYCTWNGLGKKLSEDKLLDALATLSENGIRFSNLIIDDGWQSISHHGNNHYQDLWVRFEAHKKGFPDGLKAAVDRIRTEYPEIQHIAVWHALLGYWGGIDPDGKIPKKYDMTQITRDASASRVPADGKLTIVAKDDVARFYDEFYKFLSSCGVDAVKTDVQSIMHSWIEAGPRRELIKEYLDSWIISALRHFSIKSISCMSQVPETLFYSMMSHDRPLMVARNSDDFFPKSLGSHTWHVWSNAHNAIFMQHLNILPDWDMFQTKHEYSGFHAAGRCISGGPIYITDVPGQHDVDLIHQMTAVTLSGKTVILRPSVLGKTINPYSSRDDRPLLKVGGYHGSSRSGTPMLAVLNVSEHAGAELISLSSFPGTSVDLEYVVRAHTSGKMSPPTKIGTSTSLFTAAIDVRGYEIFTAFPLETVDEKLQISCLGLLGKMTGCAAIVRHSTEKLETGRIFHTTRLKALGVLGLWISSLHDLTIDYDFMITILGDPIPRETVSISKEDEHVLEIDVEQAWKQMDLNPGWSNEVEVKVYFNGYLRRP